MSDTWNTAITEINPNSVRVRGYDIAELMGNCSFGQMVYLILRGDMPNEAIGKLMEAIIVSSIDHGATPPSVLAARTVASTGASLSASVAAGIMSINKHHGGAITNCANQLGKIIAKADGGNLHTAAESMLAEWKLSGERMSGFGHRIHSQDPRTTRLMELAKEAGACGKHIEAAHAVAQCFADAGRELPINVDGAIAALLADLGFEPEIMNGLFMIARTPGLVAHVREEQTRMEPMRKIDPVNHTYDGPSPRNLSQ